MTLQRLYKRAATGKVQICDICTIEDVVQVSWGELDGKQQHQHTPCKGKNIGRANATTPVQQAEKEALAKFAKKLKENYSTDPDAPVAFELPMLISKFEKHSKKLDFTAGVYESTKLNGINITIRLVDDQLLYFSRGGDPRPPMAHLDTDLRTAMNLLGVTELCGEMYKHGEHLQDISGAVTKPNDLTPSLEYHIFDVPDIQLPYSGRCEHMQNIGHIMHTNGVFICSAYLIDSEFTAHENMSMYVEQGFEGTVLHCHDSMYVHNTRSMTSMKLKPVLDGEYLITGMVPDKNGHPVFQCVTASGSTFKVKPKGTDAERKLIVDNYNELYHNNWYKIEYETLSRDGLPLKPVGICLRACVEGDPIE